MTEARVYTLLERLDERSIETLQRVTRIEVEMASAHADALATGVRLEALQARVDALEAERDARRGEVEAARKTGIGGALLGGVGALSAIGKAVWDAVSGSSP